MVSRDLWRPGEHRRERAAGAAHAVGLPQAKAAIGLYGFAYASPVSLEFRQPVRENRRQPSAHLSGRPALWNATALHSSLAPPSR
jgi:hypothetical protein